jgi:signal transduction histidine kinase
VRLPKLFRTSSFRLTLLYATLFGASALILLAVTYWATSFYMTSALDAAIESDVSELQQALSSGGRDHLIRTIDERVKQMPGGPIFYLLEDEHDAAVAGNLPSGSPHASAFDLKGLFPSEHDETIHVLRVRLSSGDDLLVGADARQLVEMKRLVLRAFGWCFAITLLLALGGGAIMSGSLLRRVETVSRTSRGIMAGDLSQRIPLSGADDEFDRLAASLNAMLDRTESSLEGMRQVSNDIAHDLRTPLTRLRHRLELAQRRCRSVDEFRSVIDRSIADTDAILETFGALLRIAQIEGQAGKDRFVAVDLSELLSTVAEVYQPIAEEKRQGLTVAVPPNLVVWGDRELLVQLFANLVENAIRHSPNGASVALHAAHRDGRIETVIADTGPGIPWAARDRVFRRFYRLEASRTTPGNGLGLSLVAAIASLHGIAVELADNQPGLRVSLCFDSRLPLARGGQRARAASMQKGSLAGGFGTSEAPNSSLEAEG